MVGGVVLAVYNVRGKRSVLVAGTDGERGDHLVIDVPPNAAVIKRGDQVWWQGKQLMLTPHDGGGEIKTERQGYAYSPVALWPSVAELCRQGICPHCGCKECMKDGKGSLWCPRCGESYDFKGIA